MAKYDDVSWHFDGAKFPKGEPIELGATHIGMFFKWCAINNLISEEHIQRNPEEMDQVRNSQQSGRDFIMDFCDGVLGSDDLTETGNRFAEDYYNDNTDFGKKCAEYSGDYCRAIDQGREHGEIYEFEDNPFNFEAVQSIVDHRFNEWKVFDVVRDLKQFKKNENLEDADNQYALGQFYTIGYPTSAHKKMAYEWFQKSADQGHKDAEYRVGLCHFQSQGAKFNQALGCEWFLKSAEQGVAIACFYLGQAYNYGNGKEVDKEEATIWYKKALAGGVIGAQYQLDLMDNSTSEVEEIDELEEKSDFEMIQEAANQGDSEAQYNLGTCYTNGDHVEIDEEIALMWYKKSAEQGNLEAAYYLALCYHVGIGTEKDEKLTFHWYNQCATSEDAGAQFNVGQCFELGIGQKVNMDEAIAWYKKSAAKGNQDALDKLSVL